MKSKIGLFTLFLLIKVSLVQAQLSGIYTVGTLGGEDFNSITNSGGFFQAVNTVGLNGHVVLKVTSDLISESGSVQLNAFSGGYDLKIIPNTPSIKVINHVNCSNDLFTIQGADNVIIDGRYSGWGKFLKFTSSCNNQSILNLEDDCKNVIVRNTIMLSDNSQSSYVHGGVIHVDDNQFTGSDSLKIIANDIADFSGPIDLFDAIQINSPSTASGIIEGLEVVGNNIYNANGKGIFIIANNGKTESAQIKRNSFYANGTITGPGTGWAYAIIQIESGSGHEIRANYFGGTTAKCGGTKMDIQLTSGSVLMTMIRMKEDLQNATANKIDSNVFRNMSIVNGSTDRMGAVLVRLEKGNYDIGVEDGNYVGDCTIDASIAANSSIYVEAKDPTDDSYFSFIKSSSDGVVNIENNLTGGVHFFNGVGSELTVYFYHSDGSSINMRNNQIGGSSNNIYKSALSSLKLIYMNGDLSPFELKGNAISGITVDDTFDDDLYGIHVRNGNAVPTISNNVIEDININGSNSSPRFYGIRSDNPNSFIDSNTIRKINLDSRYSTRQFNGIYCDYSSNTATLSNNLICDVTLLNTSLAVGAVGIYTSGSGSNYTIKNNKFERFELFSSSSSSYMRLIHVTSASTNTIQNNVVLIDNNNRSANFNIYGIYDYNSNSNGWTNVWHNTIDIEGTCTGTRRTACYYKNQSGDRNIQNNIFNNRRTRNTGNGENFAMFFASTSGTLIANYNLLYVEDDLDELIYHSSDRSFSDWQALGYGSSSVTTLTFQPLVDFSSGKQLTLLGNDKGASTLSILWDFEYDNRPQNTGFDMGAFELDNNNLIKALPVEMSAFSSECSDNGVLLAWETVSEINNSHFTVSMSADGNSWNVIKELAGAGNSDVALNYQCLIEREKAMSPVYYKVEQTDFDGKTSLMKLDATACYDKSGPCMEIGPNPVYGTKINLKLNACFYGETIDIRIYNALGKRMLSKSILNETVEPVTIRLNSFFQPGVYIVRISSDSYEVSDKIIVK